MTNVLLVDAYNALFQLMHVKESNVFWRFTTDLKTIISDLNIGKVVMCCDAGKSKYRLAKYPEYKSDRQVARDKADPKEVARRAQFMQDASDYLNSCGMFGIEVVKCPGVEADDIIAYFVQHTDLTKFRLAILSSDSDLFQLLRPNVVQRSYSEKMKFKPLKLDVPKKVWVNTTRFIDVYNMEPWQWAHVKSLSGDKGDSIYSPEGLGDMLAMAMVQKYGTIDSVFNAATEGTLDIPRLPHKVKVALASSEGQAMVRRNMELVNLLYTPETEADIFDGWFDYLDSAIARFGEAPEVDTDLVKERMFQDGRVKLYHECDSWVKEFRGF